MRLASWTASLTVAAATVLIGSTVGCGRGGSEEPVEETIAVTVQQARLGSLRDIVTAAGTVVPASVADFIVTANGPAEIVELPKNEGDAVQAGDILVKFDVASITNEIATRQLELGEASMRVETAKADEMRLQRLFSQGLAARVKLEAAQAAREAAENTLNQVRARVDATKALEAGTIIRARFSGVVAKRWHAPGDVVTGGEGDPILRVIDPARLQVALQIPRDQAERVAQGQVASVQTGAGTEPAIVAAKALPTGDSTTTIEVRLGFMGPTTVPLDSAVQAEIVIEELQNVLIIPAGAVQRGERGPFVWLATDAGRAARRDVQVGLTATGMTQVVGGLMPGDQVIMTGIAQLADGTVIVISK